MGLAKYFVQLLSIFFFIGEFAIYAFPAEQIAFEFYDLSDNIYASKWYTNHVTVQKLLIFIMLKSQRIHYFSGAGFVDINIDAFGSIIRKTFSFCAIIRNLLKK